MGDSEAEVSGPASVLPHCKQPQQLNDGGSNHSLSSAEEEESDSGSEIGTESPVIPKSDTEKESPVVPDLRSFHSL